MVRQTSKFGKEKRRIMRLLQSDKPILLVVRFYGNCKKFVHTDPEDLQEGYWESPWYFKPHVITKLSYYIGIDGYVSMLREIYEALDIRNHVPGEYVLTPQEKETLLRIISKYIGEQK